MNRILHIVLISLAAIVLAVSCDTNATPDNFFSSTNTELTYKGGVASFTVFSNGRWEAKWSDEGVTVTPVSGYGDTDVTVNVPANYSYSDYPVRIEFVTYIDSTSHTGKSVVTLHAAPFVVCEDRARIIGHEASKERFYVNSNHPWSVRSKKCDGLLWEGDVAPSSGTENGVWVEVSIPENTGSQPREYSVEIALDEYPDADILQLHILQDTLQ